MKTQLILAIKILARRKFFTFISLFGIALTLVVLVVATSILDGLFAPVGPEARFDRALVLYRVIQKGPMATSRTNPGYAFVRDYVLPLKSVEAATVFSTPSSVTIYRGEGRIESRVKRTDANYWKVLDFRFLEGRPYTAEEDARGAMVAVISDKLRDKLFDGKQATGGTVEIDGRRFRVIGVVPAVSMTRQAAHSEVWVPMKTARSSAYLHQFMGGYNGVVLMKNRGDRERVQREFADAVRRAPVSDPKVFTTLRAVLDTPFNAFAEEVVGGPGLNSIRASAAMIFRTVLAILAILFMTLPALNLVTLNLSRILERASEIGVRKAFGAPRRSLVWQFVLENIVLTVIGGFLAFFLAIFALTVLNRSGVIADGDFSLNLRVFLYGMATAVFFGIFSGAYPAWRMSRLDPVTALRGGAA